MMVVGYSHLLAMQAYGLQVDGKLDAAENLADKAISMNGNDRWACTYSSFIAWALRIASA